MRSTPSEDAGVKGTEDGACEGGKRELGSGADCKSRNPLNRCGARWRQGSLKQPQSSLDKSGAGGREAVVVAIRGAPNIRGAGEIAAEAFVALNKKVA